MQTSEKREASCLDTSALCPATEFNEFKHTTVLFYNQKEDGPYVLVVSSNSEDKTLSVPSTNYEGYDSAITFTAARAIVEQTKGALSPEILQKLSEGKSFTKDDLIFPETLLIPKLWENPHFKTWLRTITFCGCFHDAFQGQMFYFVEFGALNADGLNANLLALGLPLHFKWVKAGELSQYEIPSLLKEFVKAVDIAAYLKEKQAYDSLPLSRQNVYVLLLCKPDSTGAPEIDYFYDHLPGLYIGVFKRSFETWFVYNSAKGELPPDDVMKVAKGLVIPGSAASAHKDEPWLVKTREWLGNFDKEYPKTKYLGICFGEQIISHSLGGNSDVMQGKKIDPKFFIAQVEEIEVFPELFDFKFMKKNVGIIPNKLRIVEAHGDEVNVLPPGWIHCGGSKSCKIEILASKDGRYFGVQGHPEFGLQYFVARGVVYRSYGSKQPLTKEFFNEHYQKSLENVTSDDHLTRKMCYDFIKTPLEDA